jgi:catechol 2,3-dioxygenase-like lactoylglutathione lyase family enzyme
MTVEFNHTIIWARDSRASAAFLAEMLGLEPPRAWGRFQVVTTANNVNLDFMDREGEIAMRHLAFLVSEAEFDAILARIRERGLAYWADPARKQPGAVNTHDGGRGVYFLNPDGHLLEAITRPYGSGDWEP